MMTAGTFGVHVECKKAPIGYERLEGQHGIFFSAQLPDMTFYFQAPGESIEIKNALGWEFEKTPLFSGYVQHQDMFLWGQQVRCIESPGVPSDNATGYVGTLQMPTREGMVAAFCSGTDKQVWHVGNVGWKFERVAVQNEEKTETAATQPDRQEIRQTDGDSEINRPTRECSLEVQVRLRQNHSRDNRQPSPGQTQELWLRARWPNSLQGEGENDSGWLRVHREPEASAGASTFGESSRTHRFGGEEDWETTNSGRGSAPQKREQIRQSHQKPGTVVQESSRGHEGNRPGAMGQIHITSLREEVDHPRHYSHESGVECIEVMERLGANLGSAFKYLWRADEKHETPLVDLRKALWYLRRELNFEWEKSTATEERLKRVVPHETFAIGSAMIAIFEAAISENGSTEKAAAINKAIEFIETEHRRLSK